MALLTLGTDATSSLGAALVGGITVGDAASFNALVKDDQNVAHPQWAQGAFQPSGRLVIPNRGVLTVLPGDYIAVDSTTGWPILISAYAIASGPYTHS